MKLLFFIAGAQKSGTTALDRFLRRNPAVQMATPKELHFFDDDRLDWSRPDYNRLHRSFQPGDPHRVKGEATPAYLYWPPALERIRTYNPEARIIVSLRHPTFRAFSHWRMASQRGREALSFAASISSSARPLTSQPSSPPGFMRARSAASRRSVVWAASRLARM